MDSTSTSSSHPLRPYYVEPAIEASWAFDSSRPASSSARNSTYPDSLRISSTNRYESSTSLEGLESPAAGAMLQSFFMSSILSFTSTALVMPFEVGKTLAQVQWVPKDGIEPTVYLGNEGVPEEEAIELDDEAEAEAYFQDVQARGTTAFPTLVLPPRPLSPSGYLSRSGVNDELLGTKPEWIMPVVVQGGVWEMMRSVGKWKGEGWASLWKGQVTTCIHDATSASIQPILLSALTVIFLPSSSSLFSLSSLPLIHSPRPLPLLLFSVFSHAVTTVFLSPLDLVRTRLIVQSAQPQHRKYTGPLHALKTIISEEGGLWTTYFHPNLLIPALLEGILRPLLFLSTPLIISRFLRIEPSSSPITFALAELLLGTVSLLITIPIETVRKRLQIQIRAEFIRGGRINGTGRAWRSCVETRPRPYTGVLECVYRILTEETGRIPRRRRRSHVGLIPGTPIIEEVKMDLGPIGLGVGGGIGQLYRGLGIGLGANLTVFTLGLLSGGGNTGQWTEM